MRNIPPQRDGFTYATHTIQADASLASAWQTVQRTLLERFESGGAQFTAGNVCVNDFPPLFVATSPEAAEKWIQEHRGHTGSPVTRKRKAAPVIAKQRLSDTQVQEDIDQDNQDNQDEEEEEEDNRGEGDRERNRDKTNAPGNSAVQPLASGRGRGGGSRGLDGAGPITTVTNRNRKKAKQREKQQLLGIMGRFEQDEPASGEIRDFYREHAATLRWISLQEARPRDPQKVFTLIQHAITLGSTTARCTLRQVVEDWRATTAARVSSQVTLPDRDVSWPATVEQTIIELQHQMQGVQELDQAIKLSAVNRRILLADIATSVRKAEQISGDTLHGTGRHGVGRMTLIKEELYMRLFVNTPFRGSAATARSFPGLESGDITPYSTQSGSNIRSSRAWKQMSDWISHGKHWLILREELGDGFFAIIPSEVPDSWIERMDLGGLRMFATLVQVVHPWISDLSASMTTIVDRIFNGEEPPTTLLPIESLTAEDLAALNANQLQGLVELASYT